MERKTASAIGDLQIFPRQTKRTEIGREEAVEVFAIVPSAETPCFCGALTVWFKRESVRAAAMLD